MNIQTLRPGDVFSCARGQFVRTKDGDGAGGFFCLPCQKLIKLPIGATVYPVGAVHDYSADAGISVGAGIPFRGLQGGYLMSLTRAGEKAILAIVAAAADGEQRLAWLLGPGEPFAATDETTPWALEDVDHATALTMALCPACGHTSVKAFDNTVTMNNFNGQCMNCGVKVTVTGGALLAPATE